jgi:broad specificity phosphatase PhoE
MKKEYRSLRRQPFLAPVWIFGSAAAVALVAAVWAVYAASTTLVIVTRHAEQMGGGGTDPELAAAGVARAERLGAVFGNARDHAVDVVFVTQLRRTAQTARPLATRLNVPVIILPADDVATLEQRILDEYRGKRVLVIGHSNTVPQIVATLADADDVPPMAHDDYATAYVVAVPRWARPALLRLQLP